MIEEFRVDIPESEQQELKRRLQNVRWPDSPDPESWEWGTSLNYLKELTAYWRDGFDWAAQQERINSFSHFRCNLDGFRIHFIHQKGRGPRPLPILLIHGWPGSFWEMHKLIPLLTNHEESFDVVVPSLPGYGFSDSPSVPGMNPVKMAAMFSRLMEALGYSRYIVQGGDWGANVATRMGLHHSQNIFAVHLNYIPGGYKPAHDPAELDEEERSFLKAREEWYRIEGGYGHIQGTRPQTVAFGLNDSPAGLAGWIVEKFRAWSDCDGDVEKRFTKDQLLTNISIYWFTKTIYSSMRLYYESQKTPIELKKGERVEVPCCIARFPREIPMPPLRWVERGYNIRHWSEFTSGGHFAAMEEPAVLAQDIRESTRAFRDAR